MLSFVVRSATVPVLEATTREDAIEELCVGLRGEPGLPDPKACAEAVLARESLIGTGTGRGVAIPHARLEGLDEREQILVGALEALRAREEGPQGNERLHAREVRSEAVVRPKPERRSRSCRRSRWAAPSRPADSSWA